MVSLIQYSCKRVCERDETWGCTTTNAHFAILYLLLINETGYLLSNKETLLVRDTLADTLLGLYPLTCKYRGFPVTPS